MAMLRAVLALAAAAAAAAGQAEPIAAPIAHVTDADGLQGVADLLEGKKALLMAVYAPWCAHSNALAPALEEVAAAVHGSKAARQKVAVAKVDGFFHGDLTNMFRLDEFPVVVFSKGDVQFTRVRGEATADGLLGFLNHALSLSLQAPGAETEL